MTAFTTDPRRAWLLLGAGLFLAPIPNVRADDEPTPAAAYAAQCSRCHGDAGTSNTSQARALKVAPLVADARLAAMSPGEILETISTNPKHRAVLDFTAIAPAELQAAATFVSELAKRQ